MGALVPLPDWQRMYPAWLRDDHGRLYYQRQRWPWLCSYCHTVQKFDRDNCANCNAPRPAPTPEAQP